MNAKIQRPDESHPGLVLTGGGARAAYQVGVLKGIAEQLRRGSGQPVSGRHRHLRRRGERHRARLGRRALQACGLRHREGLARIPGSPCDQGRCGQRAASGLHWMLALTHRRLAGASAAFAVRQHAAVGTIAQESEFRRHPARPVQAASAGDRHLRHQLLGCGFGDLLRVLLADRALGPGVAQGRAGAADAGPFDGEPVHSLFVPAHLPAPAILRRRRHAPDLAPEPGDSSGRQSAVGHRRRRPGVRRVSACATREPSPPSGRCSASCWIRCSWTSCNRISSASAATTTRPHKTPHRLPGAHAVAGSVEIARRHRDELPRSLRALLRTMGANEASAGTLLSYSCSSAATPAS